jgi:hypothetical protein
MSGSRNSGRRLRALAFLQACVLVVSLVAPVAALAADPSASPTPAPSSSPSRVDGSFAVAGSLGLAGAIAGRQPGTLGFAGADPERRRVPEPRRLTLTEPIDFPGRVALAFAGR